MTKKNKLLDITREVFDFVTSFEAKQFKQVFFKIMSLQNDCRPNDSIKLQGKQESDYYRVDVGEYWIVYRFDENIVYVACAGKRNDGQIYKKFERKSK